MARGLYRVYLYAVTILLAVFATVSVANLLNTLFRLTSLRGGSPAASGVEVTQAALLFGVTVIVAGGFGALHYWLIRRDSAADPHINESGVRAFMLNAAEGVALVVAVTMGVGALSQIGYYYGSDVSFLLAAGLATGALAVALEWERRRATPTHGAALIFERLRRHGVPLYLLVTTLTSLFTAVSNTERVIAQNAGALSCFEPYSQPPIDYTGPYYQCVGNEVYGSWLAAALAVGAWFLFVWLSRNDARSLIRQILLLIGWTAGMALLVIALERAAEYVLRLVSPGASAPNYVIDFPFVSFLVPAAVALAVYGWALRDRGGEAPLSANTVRLMIRALGGAALAVPLWIGVAFLLYHIFVAISVTSTNPSIDTWDSAFGFIIAGLGYIPLALWLGKGSREWDINGPRRGFVLALLGAGALTTAGAAATLLFAVLSPVLNVPLDNWQDLARGAGAALITGLALGGLYLFIALREKQFIPEPKVPEAPKPIAETSAAANLDEVLAEFKGGDISQGAAVERIRELARTGALT